MDFGFLNSRDPEVVETTSTNVLYGGVIAETNYRSMAKAANQVEITRAFAPEPGVVLCRWRTPPADRNTDWFVEGNTELRASKGDFAKGIDTHVERWEVRPADADATKGQVLQPVACALQFALSRMETLNLANKPFGVVAAVRAAVWTAVRDNDELGIGSEVVRQEMDLVTDQFIIAFGALALSNTFLLYAVCKALFR